MDPDFEELSHDVNLISRIKQYRDATLRVEDTIKRVTNPPVYDKLTTADKIKYNLLMSYALNSMFWMYLRAEGKLRNQFPTIKDYYDICLICRILSSLGIDPMKHPIKSENDRLKRAMSRAKQINDRNTLMPRVNKNVAQKFIRNALFDAKGNKKARGSDNDNT